MHLKHSVLFSIGKNFCSILFLLKVDIVIVRCAFFDAATDVIIIVLVVVVAES